MSQKEHTTISSLAAGSGLSVGDSWAGRLQESPVERPPTIAESVWLQEPPKDRPFTVVEAFPDGVSAWPTFHDHWRSMAAATGTQHQVIGWVMVLLSVVSVLGNLLVVCTCMRYKSLRTSSNLLVVNLAVADLFMCVFDFPLFATASFLQGWPFGKTVCQVYAMTTATAGLVTINTLAIISLDRYYAIVHRLNPREHTSGRITGGAVAFVWVYSVLWAAAPVMGWGNYILDGIGTTCTFDYLTRTAHNRSFVLSLTFGNFVLPLAIIVFCYVRIGMKTLKINRTLRVQNVHVSVGWTRRQMGHQADVRTASIIVVLVISFLVSWFPYLVVCLIGLFGDRSRVTVMTSLIPSLIAKTSTALNPVLYSISHPKVRRKLKRTFLKVIRPIKKRGSHLGTTTSDLSGSRT